MSPTKVLLATLCMATGALAFAADPTPPVTPSSSTDTASTATADKAAADKAAADKAAADKAAADKAKAEKTEPGGITPDEMKTLRIAGYRPEQRRGGVVVYCRSEPKPYSLLEDKVCGAPNDILQSIASSKETVRQMQRVSH